MDGQERRLWEVENFANAYRNWLSSTMRAEEYGILFDDLHSIEFTWTLDMDADRAASGKDLRRIFARESGLDEPVEWEDTPCSFLEMAVALARAMEDIMYDPEIGDRKAEWFWQMMENIGLEQCDDDWMLDMGRQGDSYVESAVSTVLSRSYSKSGDGSLFPLRRPRRDQRKLALWTQMNEYLNEAVVM